MHTTVGFIKEAGIGSVLLRGGKILSRAGKSVARQAGGVTHGTGKLPRAPLDIRKRMATRGSIGAAAGVGQEFLASRSNDREFSFGAAAGKGLLGGTIGAALGTSAGKRTLRRAISPRSTPKLSLREAAKPGAQLANLKNLSPLEKGYIGFTGVDLATASLDKNPAGDRGARIGGSLGEAGGLLLGSRWKGIRRLSKGMKGTAGSIARQGALFAGASMGGSALGSAFDQGKPPKSTVAPGSNRIYGRR